MPNLAIIIGSTRPGRAGLPIAQRFAERASEHQSAFVTASGSGDPAVRFA